MNDLNYIASAKSSTDKINHKKFRLFLLYLPFIVCYIADAIVNKKYPVNLGIAWIAMSFLAPVLLVFCEDFIALYCSMYSDLSYRKKYQREYVAGRTAYTVCKFLAGIFYMTVAIYWCYLAINPPSFL